MCVYVGGTSGSCQCREALELGTQLMVHSTVGQIKMGHLSFQKSKWLHFRYGSHFSPQCLITNTCVPFALHHRDQFRILKYDIAVNYLVGADDEGLDAEILEMRLLH